MADETTTTDDAAKGDGGSINLDSPEIKAAIEKSVTEATSSYKSELDALKEQNSKLSETAKSIDGLDLDKARELLDQHEKGRFDDMVKNGEVDKLLQERVEKVSSGYQSKLDEANAKAEKIASERDALMGRITAGELAKAAAEAGVQPTAIDDVINRIGKNFTVDKDGKLAAVDGYIDSKGQPMKADASIAALKESAPHLFGQASGTGAKGNTSKGYTGELNRSKMSVSDKTAYISEHGQEAFLKLPK